jgi:hypothetical protein
MSDLSEKYRKRAAEINETLTHDERYQISLCLRGVGNPTKYDDETINIVLGLYTRGYTRAQICRELGITFCTYGSWVKKHPKFAKAHELGQILARAEWDKIGQTNLNEKNFQGHVYLQSYKSRFGTADDSNITIPGFNAQNDYKTNATAIIDSACKGEISPSQAETMLKSLNVAYNITEVDNIRSELDKIKETLNGAEK